jgi:hypothetical protein
MRLLNAAPHTLFQHSQRTTLNSAILSEPNFPTINLLLCIIPTCTSLLGLNALGKQPNQTKIEKQNAMAGCPLNYSERHYSNKRQMPDQQ